MRSHADDLRAEIDDNELVVALARDWRDAPVGRISQRAEAMCAHAEKLTPTPAAVQQADIDRLREAGCSDAAVLDATHVIGLFAWFNRIADGLGIDPEPEWEGGE